MTVKHANIAYSVHERILITLYDKTSVQTRTVASSENVNGNLFTISAFLICCSSLSHSCLWSLQCAI